MRMGMRRFTRLTNAFSKKVENHVHALALYFVNYNWMRIHKTLRITPAMAAGLTDKLMDWKDIIAIMDAEEKNTLAQKRAAMLRFSGGGSIASSSAMIWSRANLDLSPSVRPRARSIAIVVILARGGSLQQPVH
jgi:hypothetical protein